MELLKICAFRKKQILIAGQGGFSLIEVMVSLAIVAVCAGLGLEIVSNGVGGNLFQSDCDAAIGALRKARMLALNNICRGDGCVDGRAHGVYFDPLSRQVLIFQGDSYADRDPEADWIIEFENPATAIKNQNPANIIFAPLSGKVSNPGQIILRDGQREYDFTISVNSAGGIDQND